VSTVEELTAWPGESRAIARLSRVDQGQPSQRIIERRRKAEFLTPICGKNWTDDFFDEFDMT